MHGPTHADVVPRLRGQDRVLHVEVRRSDPIVANGRRRGSAIHINLGSTLGKLAVAGDDRGVPGVRELEMGSDGTGGVDDPGGLRDTAVRAKRCRHRSRSPWTTSFCNSVGASEDDLARYRCDPAFEPPRLLAGTDDGSGGDWDVRRGTWSIAEQGQGQEQCDARRDVFTRICIFIRRRR